MARDIINFQSERGRHEELLGRQDVLQWLDTSLLEGPQRGWVLVKGGPGMGKSALLAKWLRRREEAQLPVPPHHFLRRGEEDWNRPEVVKRNLAAQVERLYPEQADPEAAPESRLRDLLQRVSSQVLEPRRERLVLVVDGLDEVEEQVDDSNPLPRFLPHTLPHGVKVLCASRPMSDLSWLEAQAGLRVADLDGEQWARSNEEVVRQYCKQVAHRFVPPLPSAFVAQVVQKAEGNVLYAVMLAGWLQDQPPEQRRAELLPRGLEALLDEGWARLQVLPPEIHKVVFEGLGVLAVTREALPLSILATVAGWKERKHGEQFLRVSRPFLREEPWPGNDKKAWRFFHEYFRSFVLTKFGDEKSPEEHRRIAEHLCQWPVENSNRVFHRRYALRHGVMHWLKAGDWTRAHRLFTNVGYLAAKCEQDGPLSLEADLRSAAEDNGGSDVDCPKALHRAVQAESHVLKKDPKALELLLYNRLRCAGWAPERIAGTLHFPQGLPALRLRYPVKTGESERTLKGHEAQVLGCAVMPDGRRVVSASEDKTLKVWELETGAELITLDGHKDKVWSCVAMPDGHRVISASADKTLKLWDLETGRELATLSGHEGGVNGCSVTPDGSRVVSASADTTLKVWDVETREALLTLKGHMGGVNGCAVTPDGNRVVSASADGTLKIWELEAGHELATLEGHAPEEDREKEGGHKGEVMGCTVDNEHVVSASSDGTLKVWKLSTGRELTTLKTDEQKLSDAEDQQTIWDCALMPNGRHVVSVSSSKTLKIWDVATGRDLGTLEGHLGEVNSCAVTPDGKRVISASGDRTLKVWEVEKGRGRTALAGHKGRVRGCAATPDGRHVVSVSSDKVLKIWDVATGRELGTMKGHLGEVNSCAVTPDGKRVVSASDDETLIVWNAETGEALITLTGHTDIVKGCVLLPDGRRVVSASDDKTLKVWEMETGQLLTTLDGHEGAVSGCAVMPDGRRVVSASDDGTLIVWDVEMGTLLFTLYAHEDRVNGCAVLPDGRVISTSDDETLKVWNVQTQSELVTLTGHTGGVRGCTVMPSGKHVVSASDDGTLRVWDVDSGKCLHTLHGASEFLCVTSSSEVVCAGDTMGNVWILEAGLVSAGRTHVPDHALASPVPTFTAGAIMSFSVPQPVIDAYHTDKLALFVGSGLSLGYGVKGNFPTWKQLPHRLLDACERLDALDNLQLQAKRVLFQNRMSLEQMLSELGSLRVILGRDYQKALNDIFRPADATPGAVHHALSQLGVPAILTTNYDLLLDRLQETHHRQPYTWKESELALNDLQSGRNVLLKIHGTAERHDTVIMTEREYHEVRAKSSYQAVLSYLLQQYMFLFIGYGMNDPLDLDFVLSWNADAFKSAARRHYALLKDPSDIDRDRYAREYNVRIIAYSDHAQLPFILQQLRTTT